jgi:hypothetical protein
MGNLELFVSSLKEPQNSLMLVLIKNTTANGQGKAEAIKKIVTSAVQIEQLQKQVILVNPPNEVITKPIISLLQAFPNPFDGQIDVEFNLSQASDVKIKIISAIGIELYENSIKNLPSGENSVLLEPDNIPSGFYLISLEAGNETKILKMIKK